MSAEQQRCDCCNSDTEYTVNLCRGCAEHSFAPSACSAKFLIQRPEYPDWWAGWNEYNLPSWTSHPGHAYLVRFDELVDTLTRLNNHKPIASLYSPNAPDQGRRASDSKQP